VSFSGIAFMEATPSSRLFAPIIMTGITKVLEDLDSVFDIKAPLVMTKKSTTIITFHFTRWSLSVKINY